MEGDNKMILSEIDKLILDSYKTVVYGLADYLGPECEIVLHSLENYEKSAIVVIGQHTGRRVGAPITDLALKMLNQINNSKKNAFLSYFTKSKNNIRMKSSTIAIYGEKNRIIGLLCINYNLDSSFYKVIKNFTYPESNEGEIEIYKTTKFSNEILNENFSDDIDDLLETSIEEIKRKINDDKNISNGNKNKEIIRILYKQGLFKIKDSVIKIANKLGISKHTVYLHLRNFEK